MDRKEFLAHVGMGATVLLVPACLGGLAGCSNSVVVPAAPTNVDFTLDISTGVLSKNGGYLVTHGIVVARTSASGFLAVSADCTHQDTLVQFIGATDSFRCPNHGATFNALGQVTGGPAPSSLATYNTALSGTSLSVFS